MNSMSVSRSSSFYNWSKRSTHSVIAVDPDSWTMSFIVAISSTKLEGIMASTESILSESFTLFINEVYEEIKNSVSNPEKIWFIFDNSSLHRSKEFLKFARNKGVRCLAIPPYTPQLNAAEKTIVCIKSKLKEHWAASKLLSLGLIKTIIYNITSGTWEKWVRSTMLETLKTLKVMKNSE